ncbi:DUF4253 domain-containing protein [Streptomyces sp. NBC_00083]|uniref:DUF4253 domain-containing protein n=1 Tax=Streptomyces sp. NBC_00083 TaxID=2975647 RepID=UPI00224E19A8|nr:DUF4253 domain-containing protein [Streptomyces sp. NBC_00083]MCX5384881.1 DUF4253 domain-containing protein [Streptomyces sp. NBC_00083]
MAMLANPLPRLTDDPAGAALGLVLPSGGLVGPADEPWCWCADEPAGPRDWARLAPARRTAGLHPVLLGGVRDLGQWDLAPGEVSYPGDHDAEDVLAEFWEAYAEVELGYGGEEWPGLAEAPDSGADPDRVAAEVAGAATGAGPLRGARMALVPARRSADIPAALGWRGALSHENDVARLCAVLRSWEDRFGIRVVGLTYDQLLVSVAAPPEDREEALVLAAEHFAFCPDAIATTLQEHAESLVGARSWTFRWD